MQSPLIDRRNAIKKVASSAILLWAGGYFSHALAASAPAEIMRAFGQAKLLGQSRLVVYGFNIYDAKLWVEPGFSPVNFTNQGFALELRYLRSFNGASISERSLKEMRRLGQVSDEKAAQWLALMKQTFPDIKKGDQLIGLHQSDGSASFILNSKVIGQVQDEEFNRLFFGIWLSPQSSEPKMRSELLGLSTGARR
jgi:Chalcone isomerase-like